MLTKVWPKPLLGIYRAKAERLKAEMLKPETLKAENLKIEAEDVNVALK